METNSQKCTYRIKEFVDNIPNGRLREEKELLCAKLGISLHQLNRIIRNGSEPSGTQLKLLADHFGVSVDDLYEKAAPTLVAA